MSCTCSQLDTDYIPRYQLSASKSSYVSLSFDDLSPALNRLNELIAEGYSSVALRDNETGENDIWYIDRKDLHNELNYHLDTLNSRLDKLNSRLDQITQKLDFLIKLEDSRWGDGK